jgi:hypothetical protein
MSILLWLWISRQKVVGMCGIFWLSKTSSRRVVGIFMMSLPIGAVHSVDVGAIFRQLCFLFFFLAFLSLPPQHSNRSFKILELSSYLFIFQLWSLFFWFLVFVLDPFVKFWLVFNFIIQSQFVICYFFQFGSYFFLFLIFVLDPFIKF